MQSVIKFVNRFYLTNQAYASQNNYFLVELQWDTMKYCKYSNLVIVKELAGLTGAVWTTTVDGCNLNNEAIVINETRRMTVNPMTNAFVLLFFH